MLKVLKHVGVQVPCPNEDVTPSGNPEAESEIISAVPLFRAAVIIVTPDMDCCNVIGPPFVSEKSKGGVAVATVRAEDVGGAATTGVGATGAAAGGGSMPLLDGTLGFLSAVPSDAKVNPVVMDITNTENVAARIVLTPISLDSYSQGIASLPVSLRS